MDYKYLRSFQIVAEELNFSRAAHRLRLTPAAVTKQIQSLEDSIGLQLFVRSPKQVVMTRDARELLKKSLSFHHWVEARFHSSKQKKIYIGALEPLMKNFLPNILKNYCINHDHHIYITKGSPSQLIEKLQAGELDICLANKNIQNDVITSKKIMAEKAVLISKQKIDLKDIVHYPWITVEAKDYILNYAKKNKMGEPKKIIEVNSPMTQVDLVKRGLGVAVVSSLLVEGDRTLNRLAVPHFKNEHMYITSHNSKLIADHIQSLKKMIEDHAKQMA